LTVLAPITAAVFAFLALLHFYWAARGVDANSAAIPQVDGKPAFKPTKAATAAVGLVLLATSAIVLLQVQPLIAGAAAVLVLRAIGDFRLVGFFKRVRGSRFARLDTLLYSPLCLVLGAALALQAAG
jgi:fatty acid desaturase